MLRQIFTALLPRRPTLPLDDDSLRPQYSCIYHYSRQLHTWIGNWRTPRGNRKKRMLPSEIRVLVWNVDFSQPFRRQRLDSLLTFISRHVFLGHEPPPPCVILLQEVHRQALPLLLAHPFVRAFFNVSTISPSTWPEPAIYGNVTLVSSDLPVRAVFTVGFTSSVSGRHVVFLDIQMCAYSLQESQTQRDSKDTIRTLLAKDVTVRIANVQFESMTLYGERARLHQMYILSRYLTCPGLHGAVAGGDVIARSRREDDLASELGLHPSEDRNRSVNPARDSTGSFIGKRCIYFTGAREDVQVKIVNILDRTLPIAVGKEEHISASGYPGVAGVLRVY